VKDWDREATPYQLEIDKAKTENEKIYHIAMGISNLQTHYLKCLFSYVMFFVSLDKAYDLFYEELNKINRLPVFKVKHQKKPLKNSYIEKVRQVRNIAIAHIGSEKVSPIDSKAGMMWDSLVLSKSKDVEWDINQWAFGAMKLSSQNSTGIVTNQSVDLEIGSIHELHNQCMEYLDRFDDICACYLESLIQKLPVSDRDTKYSFLK
jgi:hypothetical protein